MEQDLKDTIVTWVDERIDDMLAAPRMWGSDEAVEMQTLLLLELRALTVSPAAELANPRRIVDAYAAHLASAFPTQPHRPLFQLITPDPLGATMAHELRKVVNALRPSTSMPAPHQREP
ncbi:MAG: hypothetical protein ABJE95_32115 [Byssovorax sp.]